MLEPPLGPTLEMIFKSTSKDGRKRKQDLKYVNYRAAGKHTNIRLPFQGECGVIGLG